MPLTGWRRINEPNVCRSSLDPGLVLGPLSQMTINYHQQVPGERVRTQYSPSDIWPRLPGSLRSRQDMIRFSSSRRQLESRASGGQITDDDDQAMIVSVVLPPARLIDASDIPSGSKAFIRPKLETGVGLRQSIDVKQHQPRHVSQLSHPRLSSQKIIISGIGHVKIITT